MKQTRTILAVSALILFYSCRSDDEGQAKKEELKNIVIDYYNALSNKDLEKANTLTTSNFILWDEGRVYNNAVAIDSVKTMPPFKATFSIDSLHVHVDKRNASAYYYRKAEFVFSDGGRYPITFLESCTFNKEGGKWKLRFMQSSLKK